MKICLASLVIRETQIKTRKRYHYIPIRMTKAKKKTLVILSVDEDGGKLELSYIAEMKKLQEIIW